MESSSKRKRDKQNDAVDLDAPRKFVRRGSGLPRKSARNDDDGSYVPRKYSRSVDSVPARPPSARIAGLVRTVVQPDVTEEFCKPEELRDAVQIKRIQYPTPVLQWSEDNTVVLPSAPLGDLPSVARQAAILQRFRKRSSAHSMSMVSCVLCFRHCPRYTVSTVTWADFLGRYSLTLPKHDQHRRIHKRKK